MTGRRLTLVVPSLELGGAEHVVAQMANHWAASGDHVTVITLSKAESDTYSLDGAVTRIALNAMRESRGAFDAVSQNLIRVRLLRRAIARTEPESLISFTDRMNVLTVLACRPLGVETVISERIDPSRYAIGRAWSWLRRRVYPSARALVVQTDRVRNQMLGVMRGRPIYVIPNAVFAPPTVSSVARDGGAPRWIVAVGRLTPQKGFDLLIEAFSRIAVRNPDWSLKILGKGPARGALEQLIASKQLTGRVILAGWQKDPMTVLRQAEFFVLSSRFEGFPNALLEAMACGLASISFDCESGPAEIVRDGVDGLLIPPEDTAALAAAMERLITNEALRHRLGSEALRVVERFGVEQYFARWESVLRREPAESVI
jgi:GalNAc-alpha-(1->4)-GalNAc-alpha-(1->3)-diNAcBac-PP-undecaprenol alpha-1,4-N-acetyl-D-galactosaminyltransferase